MSAEASSNALFVSVLQAQRAVIPPSHAVQYSAALLHLRVRLRNGAVRTHQLRPLHRERSQDVRARTLRRVGAALRVLQPRGGVLQAGGATQQVVPGYASRVSTRTRTRTRGDSGGAAKTCKTFARSLHPAPELRQERGRCGGGTECTKR